MKTLLVLTALLATSLTANAGMKDSLLTAGWEDKEPTSKYKLDTYGYAVRVYEWTPDNNPNVSCVFVAGSTNSTGVACYTKGNNK